MLGVTTTYMSAMYLRPSRQASARAVNVRGDSPDQSRRREEEIFVKTQTADLDTINYREEKLINPRKKWKGRVKTMQGREQTFPSYPIWKDMNIIQRMSHEA